MPSSPPAHRGWIFGEFTLDLDRGALIRGGANVHLSPRPFAVLRHLVERHGRLVAKDELLDAVWSHRAVTDGAVTHSLAEIRRALGPAGQGYIRTVPRRGFVFEADVTPAPEPAPAYHPVPPQASVAAAAPELAALAVPVRRRTIGWAGGLAIGALVVIVALGWGYWNRTEDAMPPQAMQPANYEEWRASSSEVEPNSVAVLPFANLSGNPEQDFFADGISEEILNRLAAFVDLKVIARTSSFALKDSGYDIPRISGLLGVNYLLQGSVRRDGQQLRISAQLVDRSGVHVWSSSFDRELGAIFTLQEEIAEAVAASIVPHIVPPETAPQQPALAAYEQYLLGREILVRRLARFSSRSAEHFTRAIALDPEFADPYAERAIALALDGGGSEDVGQAQEQAQRDIDKALALNPDLARAFAARSLLLWMREPEALAEREELLRRALALDPNMIDALNWLAIVQGELGRRAESEETYLRAIRIDPFAPSVNVNLAWLDARRGNFAEAERRLLRQLEIPQATTNYYGILFWLYRHAGRLVEQVAISKRAMLATIELEASEWYLNLAVAYAGLGMWDRADYWQTRAEQTWPEQLLVRMSRIQIDRAAGRLAASEAAGQYRAALDEASVEPGRTPRGHALVYGELQALAGEYEGAIETLEPLIYTEALRRQFLRYPSMIPENARHALAWAWLQTGAHDKAANLLESDDEGFRKLEAEGQLRHFGNALAQLARNTLMLGDADRALELLDQAAGAGWREYYLTIHDPRWASVRDAPKFQSIMARVKADIDLQRARMEEIDAADDFIARLDAALAVTAAASKR